MINRITRYAAALVFVGAASSAQAMSTFTDEAAFLGALGGSPVTTFDFESSSPGDLIRDSGTGGPTTLLDPVNGLDATFDNFSFGLPIIVDNFFPTTSGSNYIGADDGSFAFLTGDSFTVSFASDLQAAGLYIVTDVGIPFADDFTLTTSAGHSVGNSDLPSISLFNPPPDDEVAVADAFFIGLIADDPTEAFSSFTFSSLDIGFDNYQFNIDDISVSGVSPIPVPAAVWMFGTALLGLLGLSRKKAR